MTRGQSGLDEGWINEAVGQIERLFHYNQLMVLTFYYEARAGTVGARLKHFLQWRDASPVPSWRSPKRWASRSSPATRPCWPGCYPSVVEAAFEEVFDEIGFRIKLKRENWGPREVEEGVPEAWVH